MTKIVNLSGNVVIGISYELKKNIQNKKITYWYAYFKLELRKRVSYT